MTVTKTKTTRRAVPLEARHAHSLTAGRATPVGTGRARTIARVAAQLAREDAGRYMSLNELSAYAVSLADAGYAARRALASGQSPKPHYGAAREIVRLFGAELVDRGDLDGMVLGVKWASGRFSGGGSENIFYVA